MRIIYITCPSKEEALTLSHTLVGEGVVACTNIIENMTSVYRWEGEVRQDSEVVVIAKTTEKMVDAAINRIKMLHSYDCPCVLAIKIEEANKDFVKWVETSLKLL